MRSIPAYRKVYSQLKQQIKDNQYEVGSFLPPEAELEALFSVSRTTIRKAIGLLVNDGYLSVRQGRGTEVLDVSTTQRLNHVSSVTETLVDKGYSVSVQGMDISLIEASAHVAENLEIPKGSPVYLLQRVLCADGAPIAFAKNYLSADAFPNFLSCANHFIGLYQFLEKNYSIVISEARERLSAVSAEFTESQILKVPVGSPLLCSKRITYMEQAPLDYSVTKLVADKYEYSIYMQGRT